MEPNRIVARKLKAVWHIFSLNRKANAVTKARGLAYHDARHQHDGKSKARVELYLSVGFHGLRLGFSGSAAAVFGIEKHMLVLREAL